MNGDFRSFVEMVRSRSDIATLIGADLDLRPSGGTLKALSPFHPETSPSLVVWPATQTWHDFSNGGGLGGDAFSYVQLREGIGFQEAVYRLAERSGVRRPDLDDESWKQELETMIERRGVRRLQTAAAMYYHRVLPSKIREENFQGHYGFTDETIDSLRLGWADGHLFDHLTEALGASRDLALKTGLFVVVAGGRVEDFFRDRLVFPYWKEGQVVYFIARATGYTGDEEWERSKYKKLLTYSDRHSYVSPSFANDCFFNEDAARGAEDLLITEGVTDCISAMQVGIPCISPVTTRFRKQDIPKLLQLTRNAKRIVICNDAEANGAGEAGALETAAELWAQGRDARIAVIPRPEGMEKIDLNELVATAGSDALRDVLAGAKLLPYHLLGRIPKDTPKEDLDPLLEPVLQSLTGRSPILTDAVLDAVTKQFGVKRRALLGRLKYLSARKKVEAARDRATTTSGAVPEIQVGGRQLREIICDARSVVIQANDQRIQRATLAPTENEGAPLFVRGGNLAILQQSNQGVPCLAEVTETRIFGYLLREADWIQMTEGGTWPVFPPKDIARDLITYPPPGIPTVESVISTPVFGRNGNLILSPGLHQEDHLWLEADPHLDVGQIPEQPTAEDIEAAQSLFMDDLFVDFPFASEADRANALAGILLPFARPMIDGFTPLHLVDGSTVGSGKGLYCNLVSITVTGSCCESRTLADSEDEKRKAITAELTLARPIILIDNVKEGATLVSPALASVLTTRVWKDRILGGSVMASLPVRGMWLLTGNNVRLSRDLARRSVRIRIAPKQDQPWLRENFKHDPIISWAVENRNRLVRAALILIQAWISSGRPRGKARLGSYEEWASVMGGVLEVAGVAGFLGNIKELYADADADDASWREFTAAWWDRFQDADVRVAELVDLCERDDLMVQIRGDGSTRSQQSRLGRALQAAKDRVFGEFQLCVDHRDRDKRTVWSLKKGEGASGLFDAESGPQATTDLSAEGLQIDPWE